MSERCGEGGEESVDCVGEQFELGKRFRIQAAHYRGDLDSLHSESHLHGHLFVIDLVVFGTIDEKMGWVVDFGEMSRCFEPIRRQLDHRLLNDIGGLEIPSAARLARWIYERLLPTLRFLHRVEVREPGSAKASYPIQTPPQRDDDSLI